MKRVYSASDLIDARLLADSLAEARIETHLFNANAVGAMGDIPFASTWPEVWIADERDSVRAETIVRAHAARPSARGTVRCAGCGEDNPSNFDTCWNCAAMLDGSLQTGAVNGEPPGGTSGSGGSSGTSGGTPPGR
ncbi:MAG: DUF2007 domain-containing protein [Proteobacteria bacterium]|nr:DUF2007 domain-containing protein [Burkholderiales bacterium]